VKLSANDGSELTVMDPHFMREALAFGSTSGLCRSIQHSLLKNASNDGNSLLDAILTPAKEGKSEITLATSSPWIEEMPRHT
jgi:hypothetical protein